MIQEGHIVLFKFPQTDQTVGKLRPALVIRRLPGVHDDWLICMISSQLSQQIPDFDEVVKDKDMDFKQSGLKTSSVIRICRLAVVNRTIFLGSIGSISTERLELIKKRLSDWIKST
ncbi:MAG: type II toxin-antitoxin system PemK/MazF family toxin [Nitrospirae bacterium]|nr:type II toxin-antitoxin system PemK/MazF family toxin [Nitrospirota bacterium]